MKPTVFSKIQNELEQYRLDAADSGVNYAHTRVNNVDTLLCRNGSVERPEQEMKNGVYTESYELALSAFNLYKRLVKDGNIDERLKRNFVNDASNIALQRFESFVADFSKHVATEYGSVSVATLIDSFDNDVMRMKVEFDDRLPVYFSLTREFSIDRTGSVNCEWNFEKRD